LEEGDDGRRLVPHGPVAADDEVGAAVPQHEGEERIGIARLDGLRQ
jgi:hypothetical protein